jgi:hypothetical protein
METTLEHSSLIDKEIAAAAPPVIRPSDPLREIDNEIAQAREKLEALAVGIADGETVDKDDLRELMRTANVDRSFVDERIERRRKRVKAAAALEKAANDKRRADELKQQHAAAGALYRAEETRLEQLKKDTLEPINQDGIRLYGEYTALEAAAARSQQWALATLRETAHPSIARIDALSEESRRISHQSATDNDGEISNRADAIERRAKFWRGWMERLADRPFAPQRPANLSREDYAVWGWFFQPSHPIYGSNMQAAREGFVQSLERQAHELRDNLRRRDDQRAPFERRRREINAEIKRLEELKYEV